MRCPKRGDRIRQQQYLIIIKYFKNEKNSSTPRFKNLENPK